MRMAEGCQQVCMIPLLPDQGLGGGEQQRSKTEALQVENGVFAYRGGPERSENGLRGVTVRVPSGITFGLLGPSGCGKTTLLKCLSGLLEVQEGRVLVFGKCPWEHPGANLGYMPQDLSLYDGLTVSETLSYYGGLKRLPSRTLLSRKVFLVNLLALKGTQDHLIRQLSTGQQRRVSLAVALIHDPPLLLLDEPTAGADPLLRRSIWEHLRRLSRDNGTTIVITTHYIEEARRADAVAFMRQGRILLAGTPDYVMSVTHDVTLEGAFLKLCMADETWGNNRGRITEEDNGIHDEVSIEEKLEGRVRSEGSSVVEDVSGFPPEETEQFVDKPHVQVKVEKEVLEQPVMETDEVLEQPLLGNNVSRKTAVICKKESSWKPGPSEFPTRTDGSRITPVTKREGHNLGGSQNVDLNGLQCPDILSCDTPVSGFQDLTVQVSKTQTCDKRTPQMLVIHFMSVVMTICWKNLRLMRRNLSLVVVALAVPVFNVLLAKMVAGRAPFDLVLTVVNAEERLDLSVRFLEHLDRNTFVLTPMRDPGAAVAAVERGEAWASLHIHANFSDILKTKAFEDIGLAGWPFKELQVASHVKRNSSSRGLRLYADATNLEVYRTVVMGIQESYQSFAEETMADMGLDPVLIRHPLLFERPVFGLRKPEFSDFMNANVVSDSLFICAMGLSALTFVTEKGHWDRARVTGVTPGHLLASQILLQGAFSLIQVCSLIVFLWVGQRHVVGSLWLVAFLCYMNSFVGLALGIFISAMARTPAGALILVTLVYQVNGLGCGMLWPSESHPAWLRPVTSLFPEFFSIRAIREILFKDWSLSHASVQTAILASLLWTLVPMAGTLVALRWASLGAKRKLRNKITKRRSPGAHRKTEMQTTL